MQKLNNIEINNCVGQVCRSRNYGNFIITHYNNALYVEVEFIKTGYKTKGTIDNIRCGRIKDVYVPSVHTVGIIGEKYPVHYLENIGKKVKEYSTWYNMLMRCYSKKWVEKYPTYKGCSVSENFKHYEYFYEWCNRQIGFNNEGWQLDKDLIHKGNKVYSEETCIFLPQELNKLITKTNAKRGDYPIGVTFHKASKKFSSVVNINKTHIKHLGLFDTPEETFYAYKEAKEAFIKEQALKWKDEIDPRAFEALMNYEVDIND